MYFLFVPILRVRLIMLYYFSINKVIIQYASVIAGNQIFLQKKLIWKVKIEPCSNVTGRYIRKAKHDIC